MSETVNPTEAQGVTAEDLELSVRVIAQWHAERNLAFAIVNSGAGIMISQGNAFELEGALNHGHKLVEFDNGQRLMQLKQRHESGGGPTDEEIAQVEAAVAQATAETTS